MSIQGDEVKKAKKQIAAVIAVGIVLIAADTITSKDQQVEVVSSDGQLYLIRPEAGEDNGHLSLTAKIKGESGTYEKRLNIMLEPYGKEEKQSGAEEIKISEETEEEQLEYSLRSIADGVNEDVSVKKVSLPDKLETGETIKWTTNDTSHRNTLAILVMMAVVSAIIYREQFSAIKKLETERRESVLRQLPGFINRLVLLLNAGMVLTGAFEKAVEESIESGSQQGDYFYDNLRGIYISIKTANGSLDKELRNFAGKSGVRELMRVSNIITDNVNKGTELIYKLEGEAEMLWSARKKRCEELGKMAETKLTLPLVLFLLALIVITTAPALLGL